MDLMTALSAIQQTLGITKELRDIDGKIDAAVWKLKLNEIIEKLIETKDALIDEKELQKELKAEIERLEAKLADRGRHKDENGQLFEIDTAGNKVGVPYCNHCYVKEEKLFRLRHHEARPGIESYFRCDNCKITIFTGPGLPMPRAESRNSWIR